MVKQKTPLAHYFLQVKGISFEPEFFIYAAAYKLEGIRGAGTGLRLPGTVQCDRIELLACAPPVFGHAQWRRRQMARTVVAMQVQGRGRLQQDGGTQRRAFSHVVPAERGGGAGTVQQWSPGMPSGRLRPQISQVVHYQLQASRCGIRASVQRSNRLVEVPLDTQKAQIAFAGGKDALLQQVLVEAIMRVVGLRLEHRTERGRQRRAREQGGSRHCGAR